jgi:hypothetical protein
MVTMYSNIDFYENFHLKTLFNRVKKRFHFETKYQLIIKYTLIKRRRLSHH